MAAQPEYLYRATVADVPPSQLLGSLVLLRCNLNVPFVDDCISDSTLLEAAVPTMRLLAAAGAKVAIASHWGTPRSQAADLAAQQQAQLAGWAHIALGCTGAAQQNSGYRLGTRSLGLVLGRHESFLRYM